MQGALLTCILTIGGALSGVSADLSFPLWRPGDTIVERKFIPSESNRHGELRVVQRGPARCVQTLLYSASLPRGLRAIRNKEIYYWPPRQAGHEDSTNYLALLQRAVQTLRAGSAPGPDDPREKVLIEFILDGDQAGFAIYQVDLEEAADGMQIRAARPLEVSSASTNYIRRDMELMAATALQVESDSNSP